ncbi:MAG TPA: response regulator [Pyrinomonadaceae bacterium]|nr:response regulator [Pyrinomonadaceae bacterium]
MSSIKRILCAEPHGDTCELIGLLLRQEGYEVKWAASVADSLELAAAETFDLYILNDRYFDGDGIELCRRLRALNPETPLLLLSENASASDRRRALEAGAQNYVPIPEGLANIVQTVGALFKQAD